MCVSNWGSDIDRMEQHQIVKARVCLGELLSKILRSSRQFYKIQNGGWPREVLHVTKRKTVRKWELNELNASDNFANLKAKVLFLGRFNNIYTI